MRVFVKVIIIVLLILIAVIFYFKYVSYPLDKDGMVNNCEEYYGKRIGI